MPKSSIARPTPSALSRDSARPKYSTSLMNTLSVISRHSSAGANAGARQDVARSCAAMSGARSWRTEMLTATDIAGSGGAAIGPAARHACSSTHAPIGTMSPVSSAIGMNSVGADQAALGVFPAQQCLGADHRAGRQVDDGLVVDDELAAVQGVPQLDRGRRSELGAGPQGARRTADAIRGRAPSPRYIAASESRSRLSGVASASATAMPRLAVTLHFLVARRGRPAQRAEDPLGDLLGLGRGGVLAHDDELVPAEPRHGVARPDARRSGRRPLEQLVAGGVAQRVVDDLEVVEVEEHHRRAACHAPRAPPGRARAGR